MKIIFWQNIISPHQSFLIRELSKRHEVILAVLQEISKERMLQGWSRPDIGQAKVVILNNKETALNVYKNNKDAVQIFSGIASYNILKKVFKSLDKNSRAGVMVEAGSTWGWQKHVRKALYTLKYIQYNHKIDFIFAMGDLGVRWYQSVGFPKSKLIKFQYFTELPNLKTLKEPDVDAPAQLLFIGQLIERKNINGLVNALIHLKDVKYKLNIIGDGPLKSNLQNLVKQNNMEDRIIFLGNLNNSEAMDFISKSDYLILPSKFDGWGAVINEALSRGTKVITNENCGACCMVKEMNCGVVYKNNSNNSLQNVLQNILNNFKRESHSSRTLTAARFADQYSYATVERFEDVLRTL